MHPLRGGIRQLMVTQTHKDLPDQFVVTAKPLDARIVVASLGTATPLSSQVFKLQVQLDPNVPAPTYEKPERYGKKPQINHIFKDDPKNPPRVISAVFVLIIMGVVPMLFGVVSVLHPEFLARITDHNDAVGIPRCQS